MEQIHPPIPWDDLSHFDGGRIWRLAPSTYRSFEIIVGDEDGQPDSYLLRQAKEVCDDYSKHECSAIGHLREFVTALSAEDWCIDSMRFETPNSFIAELSNSDDTYGFWTIFMDGSRFDGGEMTYTPTRFTRTQQ